MWRDLLMVMAAMLGRLALVAAPTPDEAQLADWLLYGLSAYLVFSIGITLFTNVRFMCISRTSRANWQDKLYGFVDPDDLKALAIEPIEAAERTYRWAQKAAIAAYLVVIVALVAFAMRPAHKRVSSDKQGGTAKTMLTAPVSRATPAAAATAAPKRLALEPSKMDVPDVVRTPAAKQKANGESTAKASRKVLQVR